MHVCSTWVLFVVWQCTSALLHVESINCTPTCSWMLGRDACVRASVLISCAERACVISHLITRLAGTSRAWQAPQPLITMARQQRQLPNKPGAKGTEHNKSRRPHRRSMYYRPRPNRR